MHPTGTSGAHCILSLQSTDPQHLDIFLTQSSRYHEILLPSGTNNKPLQIYNHLQGKDTIFYCRDEIFFESGAPVCFYFPGQLLLRPVEIQLKLENAASSRGEIVPNTFLEAF